MSRAPYWTPEECEYLQEHWGVLRGGVDTIAKKLGRTRTAVVEKARKMGLGPWFERGELLTMNQLIRSLFGDGSSYAYIRLKGLGFPTCRRHRLDCSFEMIRIDKFWKWAERHQNDLSFARFEEGTLGAEPQWAKEKRKRDFENQRYTTLKKAPWSPMEDAVLKTKCTNGVTWAELERTFNRSNGAIRRRIYDLDLPYPIRSKKPTAWSDEDGQFAWYLHERGYSYAYIANHMGRTASAVRGKIEWIVKKLKKGEEVYGIGEHQNSREAD